MKSDDATPGRKQQVDAEDVATMRGPRIAGVRPAQVDEASSEKAWRRRCWTTTDLTRSVATRRAAGQLASRTGDGRHDGHGHGPAVVPAEHDDAPRTTSNPSS